MTRLRPATLTNVATIKTHLLINELGLCNIKCIFIFLFVRFVRFFFFSIGTQLISLLCRTTSVSGTHPSLSVSHPVAALYSGNTQNIQDGGEQEAAQGKSSDIPFFICM